MAINDNYLFFWGEAPFSQWTHSLFSVNETEYSSAEQYMMAEKARFFQDDDTEAAIMEATLPSDQKRLGRQVRNFHAERWNNVARDIVYDGNEAKFRQNPEMKEQLFETYPKILVEASPYDTIWGIGMSDFEAKGTPPEQWRGTNWLGEVLTNLRDDLMREEGLI